MRVCVPCSLAFSSGCNVSDISKPYLLLFTICFFWVFFVLFTFSVTFYLYLFNATVPESQHTSCVYFPQGCPSHEFNGKKRLKYMIGCSPLMKCNVATSVSGIFEVSKSLYMTQPI